MRYTLRVTLDIYVHSVYTVNMKNISRPELKGCLRLVAIQLAKDRSNPVHTKTLTQLVSDLVFEEWQRKYSGMMFPDENGDIVPLECTPSRVKP